MRTAKRPFRSVLFCLLCATLLVISSTLHAGPASATLITNDASASGLGADDPATLPFRDFWNFVADHLVPRVCGCFAAHDPRVDFDAPDLQSQFADRWYAGHFDGFGPLRLFGDAHFRVIAFEIVERLISFEKTTCTQVPELGTGVLAASGLIGLAFFGRRRRDG